MTNINQCVTASSSSIVVGLLIVLAGCLPAPAPEEFETTSSFVINRDDISFVVLDDSTGIIANPYPLRDPLRLQVRFFKKRAGWDHHYSTIHLGTLNSSANWRAVALASGEIALSGNKRTGNYNEHQGELSIAVLGLDGNVVRSSLVAKDVYLLGPQKIASSRSGELVVAWVREMKWKAEWRTNRYELWIRRCNSTGTCFPEQRAATDIDGNLMSVSVNDNGIVVASWTRALGRRNWSLHAKVVAINGGESIEKTIAENFGNAGGPHTVIDSAGNAHVAWVEGSNAVRLFGTNPIMHVQFNPGKMAWKEPELLARSTSTGGEGTMIAFASNQNGRATIVWYERSSGARKLTARLFHPESGWGVPTVIESVKSQGSFRHLDAAVESDGRTHVIYVLKTSDPENGKRPELRLHTKEVGP